MGYYILVETHGKKGHEWQLHKKLWHILLDRDMKKKDLAKAADISNYTITKMTKGKNVTVDILGKICTALNCGIDDIMEFITDEKR